MKIGFGMVLWSTFIDESHRRIMEDIKATGYDGVEIPIFSGEPSDYRRLGKILDEIGLERTSISVIQTPETNPISPDKAVRKAAVEYLRWCIDCTEAVGGTSISGPLHSTIGLFSGAGPTDQERAWAREVHLPIADYAASKNIRITIEAINRFECYFANTADQICSYVSYLDHPAVIGMIDTFHANIEELDTPAAVARNVDRLGFIHISENDRGVPGRGQVPFSEIFKALKSGGYDGWLTIEAFGRAMPDLAAATKIWRDLSKTPEEVYREGYRTIREGWDRA